MGVLTVRALLFGAFGVCIRAPNFWKLTSLDEKQHNAASNKGLNYSPCGCCLDLLTLFLLRADAS